MFYMHVLLRTLVNLLMTDNNVMFAMIVGGVH